MNTKSHNEGDHSNLTNLLFNVVEMWLSINNSGVSTIVFVNEISFLLTVKNNSISRPVFKFISVTKHQPARA